MNMDSSNKIRLIHGDCLEKLKDLADNSIDSVVCDAPYGLSFMNKKWDYDVPSTEIWTECLRVLKPGGHLLSFSGSRTYHRMAVRIEDAGFEIRDQIMWIYGSGFPKSHNIGKAVDKLQGNEREYLGETTQLARRSETAVGDRTDSGAGMYSGTKTSLPVTKGNTEWEGWGTALKPAHEPIVVARKPLSEKSVAENVLKWGTGGINIDESRIGYKNDKPHSMSNERSNEDSVWKTDSGFYDRKEDWEPNNEGRWPANIILDEEAGQVLDEQSGESSGTSRTAHPKGKTFGGGKMKEDVIGTWYGDKGGASRFFYCPKASKKDRDEGLDGFEEKFSPTMGDGIGMKEHNPETATPKKNGHPTVKPTALMEYLIKLVTPVGGTVLDPFMGSGSTGKASVRNNFNFVGIEREKEYIDIATARINNELKDK